jgi:hypothetical protein
MLDNDGKVILALVYFKYEDISAFNIKATIVWCGRHMLWSMCSNDSEAPVSRIFDHGKVETASLQDIGAYISDYTAS